MCYIYNTLCKIYILYTLVYIALTQWYTTRSHSIYVILCLESIYIGYLHIPTCTYVQIHPYIHACVRYMCLTIHAFIFSVEVGKYFTLFLHKLSDRKIPPHGWRLGSATVCHQTLAGASTAISPAARRNFESILHGSLQLAPPADTTQILQTQFFHKIYL